MGVPINLYSHKIASRLLYKVYAAFNLPPYKYALTADEAYMRVMDVVSEETLNAMFHNKPPSKEEIRTHIEYFFSEEALSAIQYAIDTKAQYFGQFPDMKLFLDNAKKTGKTRGWVKNFYGRKYFFEDPATESYKAPNYIIQGTCSGICKDRGMASDKFLLANRKSPLTYSFIPIHDEIGFQVHMSDLMLARKLPGILSDIPFRVPMTWGADWGTNLDERIDLESDSDWDNIKI